MTITQTVEIPADYRLYLDLPRSIPVGTKARIEINIPAKITKNQPESHIEHVRLLLREEMSAKGTSALTAESGDGWEAHVMERHAES